MNYRISRCEPNRSRTALRRLLSVWGVGVARIGSVRGIVLCSRDFCETASRSLISVEHTATGNVQQFSERRGARRRVASSINVPPRVGITSARQFLRCNRLPSVVARYIRCIILKKDKKTKGRWNLRILGLSGCLGQTSDYARCNFRRRLHVCKSMRLSVYIGL